MSQNNSAVEAEIGDGGGDTAKTHCRLQNSSMSASFSIFILNILLILISCKIVHSFLRRLGQHRMISDFIIGVLMGYVKALRFTVEDNVIIAIVRSGYVAFSFYLFALGLEMEPRNFLDWSGPATKLAYSGIISTSGITILCYIVINFSGLQLVSINSYQVICAMAIGLAATSSPILTRLITELKIGKSEIGRIAVRAGLANDMICTSLMCIGVLFYGASFRNPEASLSMNIINAILNTLFLTIEVCFIFKIINPFLGLLNDRNPEGKPIRGIDMLIVSIVSAMLCFSSILFGFDPNFNSFIVGLCLPREGRMSNFLISKINFALTTLILPLYVVLVGFSTDYKAWATQKSRTISRFLVIGSIGVIGKLTGTVACCIRFGFLWPEAIALGLLLNVKGYFHIFCAYTALVMNVIDPDMMMVMMLVTIGTIIPTPLVVAFIVRRARAREQRGSAMGLQWCNAGGELRVLIGLHGVQDVGMAVNVMEAMSGKGNGEEGRLVAYVMDLVEMTDKAAASLVQGEGMEAVTVRDEEILEMREQIGSALEAYREESGEGVRVRRMLAVSTFDCMHQDICNTAQDCLALLVVLPFHRRKRLDGSMDSGHPGHRLMNLKVLQQSPCSVAILVNRGLGRRSGSQISSSFASQNICVVFIGGQDDREALAYASRVAQHPGVRLTVVRFLPDAAASGKVSGPGRRVLSSLGKQEMEMKADDEHFAGFYERYVAGGKGVGYMEKHVGSGAETVATLRALEGQYELFVVGRGKERDSVLTAGMSEWAECPELGPIGDILAATDFSATASVLVIQHCNAAGRFDVIDEEFLPMGGEQV